MTTNTVSPATIRAAKQILEDRSNERRQIAALRSELAAIIADHARATADASMLAGALDAATRKISALLSENASLRASRAAALMALDEVAPDALSATARSLVAAATALCGAVGDGTQRARQWPVIGVCVACGGAHDVQACPDIAALRDADPFDDLYDELAQAQTVEEREQVAARIDLARAEAVVAVARAAL